LVAPDGDFETAPVSPTFLFSLNLVCCVSSLAGLRQSVLSPKPYVGGRAMRKSALGFVLASSVLVVSCDGATEQQTTPSAENSFALTAEPDSSASSTAALDATSSSCGGPGQTCCFQGSGLACRVGICLCHGFPDCACPPCGGSGQFCCEGNTCNAGLSCVSKLCKPPCGGSGQACCTGSICNSGLLCTSGVCGPSCGDSGQACCTGSTCNSGLSCASGVCGSSCGGYGQVCCAGNTCKSGQRLVCSNSICTRWIK
jgi:hypothetical protein